MRAAWAARPVLVTTEAMVAEKPKKEEPMPGAPMSSDPYECEREPRLLLAFCSLAGLCQDSTLLELQGDLDLWIEK